MQWVYPVKLRSNGLTVLAMKYHSYAFHRWNTIRTSDLGRWKAQSGELAEDSEKHNYKGLLSQEITAIEYCFDPAAADIRNYQQFKPFME